MGHMPEEGGGITRMTVDNIKWICVAIIAAMIVTSGCTSKPISNCVPVYIEKVYPVSWESSPNQPFVTFSGVAIIGGEAYFITADKYEYDALKDNTTAFVAIGSAGAPEYRYIYEVCNP